MEVNRADRRRRTRFCGKRIRSIGSQTGGRRLIEEIRPFLGQHGVETETVTGASRKLCSKSRRMERIMERIKMFPGKSSDPVLSGWSSGRFSLDVVKGSEACGEARTGYGCSRQGLGGGDTRHGGQAGSERKGEGGGRFRRTPLPRLPGRFFTVRSEEVRITVSVGVAVYPEDGITFAEFMRAANIAEHKAKSGGRNRVVMANASGAA